MIDTLDITEKEKGGKDDMDSGGYAFRASEYY